MSKERIDEFVNNFVNNPEFVIVHTRSDEERSLIKKIIEIIRPRNKGWKYSIRKMIKYNTIEIGLFSDFGNKYENYYAYYIISCNSIGFCNIKEYKHSFGKFRRLSRTERKLITPDVVELYDLLFNQSDYILK